jgi:uncharacterized protein involved in outer membrane biogenesis
VKRMIRNILVVVVLILVTVFIARNSLIKSGAKNFIQQATGFDLEVGGLNAGLFSSAFEINDLKLINPEDFPEATAMDIKRMSVSYDLPSFFTDEIHLREVVLDVPLMVVVQKEDGESNLQRLSEAGQGKDEPGQKTEEDTPAESKAKKPAKKFRIDTLTLKFGAVEVHKYIQGQDKPDVQKHELNINRTYTNITDPNQLAVFFTAAMLEGAGLQMFKDIGKALDSNQGDLDKTGKELEKTAKDLGKQLKGLFQGAK